MDLLTNAYTRRRLKKLKNTGGSDAPDLTQELEALENRVEALENIDPSTPALPEGAIVYKKLEFTDRASLFAYLDANTWFNIFDIYISLDTDDGTIIKPFVITPYGDGEGGRWFSLVNMDTNELEGGVICTNMTLLKIKKDGCEYTPNLIWYRNPESGLTEFNDYTPSTVPDAYWSTMGIKAIVIYPEIN